MSQPLATSAPPSALFPPPPPFADYKSKDAFITYGVIIAGLVVIFVIIWLFSGKKYEVVPQHDENGDEVIYRVESGTGFWVVVAVTIAIIALYKLANKAIDKW